MSWKALRAFRTQREDHVDTGAVDEPTQDTSLEDQMRLPAGLSFRPLAGEPSPFEPCPPSEYFPWEAPLDNFQSERELADRVLERLEPWFLIQREVRGVHCSGKRLRVDAMIRPRDADRWRDPDVAFGVEFKLPRPDAGTYAYTGWVAQAVSYTHVDWQGYGRRVILTCPGASAWLDKPPGHATDFRRDLPVEYNREHEIAKRLMGQLDVGELVLRWGHGLSILVNGERMWSERRGVGRGRTWRLRPRSGSR